MTEEAFYQKIPGWIGADRSTWNHVTLFAYFCHKYEEKTGVRFKMVRSKAGPTSTKETRDFAKILKIFCPDDIESLSDAEISGCRADAINKAYNYINWMFDYKHRRSPAVSGTQIFLVPSAMNEFERMYAAHLLNKKSSSGFNNFLEWVKVEAPDALDRFKLETKDDLGLFVKYVQNSEEKEAQAIMIMEKILEMRLI